MSEGVYWENYGQVVFAECYGCDRITAHHATYVGYSENRGWVCGSCRREKSLSYKGGKQSPSWDEDEVLVTLKQYNELAKRVAALEAKLALLGGG